MSFIRGEIQGYGLVLSHFRPLPVLVVVAVNTIHQKSSWIERRSFLLPQVGLLWFLLFNKWREFDFNYNLGWSLSLGMGLAGGPAC